MSNIVYLNNKFINQDEAKINIGDRSYLFGDGIYEAFLYSNGDFIDFNLHFQRLINSLKLTQMKNFTYTKEQIKKISNDLIDKNNANINDNDIGIYIQISRDVVFPRVHNYKNNATPSLFACLLVSPKCKDRLKPLKLKSFSDIRWQIRQAKTTMLMPNTMIKSLAIENDYDDGLFVQINESSNQDNSNLLQINNKTSMKNASIREASASNIFFIDECDNFITPKDDGKILSGITRMRIIEILKKNSINVIQKDIFFNDIKNYKGSFLSASIARIKPIGQIDDIVFKGVHPKIEKIILQYEEFILGKL